jgi:hypothetical protein
MAVAGRAAAATQAALPHPERCGLGGAAGCSATAEIKIADSWGDSSEELGGLAESRSRRSGSASSPAYVNR